MDIYASEQEQVEALRKWWRENWKALALGLLIGFGGLFGYRFWQDHQTARAESAADIYQQVLNAFDRRDLAGVRSARAQLEGEYSGTPYVTLAALVEARLAAEAGDLDAARKSLERVVGSSEQPAVVEVARLRLARVLVADGDYDAAREQLEAIDNDGVRPLVDELLGDIHRLRGEAEAAAEAYRRSLAAGGENAPLLRMKLDDLGLAAAEETQ